MHPQRCRGAELQGGCSRNDAEAEDAAGLVVLRQRCCCGTMGVPHRSISPLLPPARTSQQCLVAPSPQGWPEEVAAGVSPAAPYRGSLVGQAVTQAAASPGDTPGAVGTPPATRRHVASQHGAVGMAGRLRAVTDPRGHPPRRDRDANGARHRRLRVGRGVAVPATVPACPHSLSPSLRAQQHRSPCDTVGMGCDSPW